MMPNPWMILAAVVAWAASILTAGVIGLHVGEDRQQVADQKQIDATNAQISENKSEAARLMQTAQQANIDLMTQRDTLKTQLEQDHVKNQQITNNLRASYTGGLRFAASESAGRGDCGGGTVPQATAPASPPVPAVCQLSNEATSDLRQLAYDADDLRDAYTLCYDWAHAVK